MARRAKGSKGLSKRGGVRSTMTPVFKGGMKRGTSRRGRRR